MAYNPDNLGALSYANGFTLWCYTSPDSAESIMMPGYFEMARSMLRRGDVLLISSRIDERRAAGFAAMVTHHCADLLEVRAITSLPAEREGA